MSIDTLTECASCAHSRQVSKISELLAESMGYAPDEIAVIQQAALLHDIGKINISDKILNKPGILTPEEYELVKTHTTSGYNEIIKVIDSLTLAAEVCRDHHERPDGSGYNGGVTGEHIHPYSSIVAAADVFDALYSERSYKEAWVIDKIIKYFQENSGTQFDAAIVERLLLNIENIQSLYNQGVE